MNNLPKYVQYVLMAITLVVCGLFLWGGSTVENFGTGDFDTPNYTETLLNWAYVLIFAACVVTIIFAVYTFITKLKYDAKSAIVPAIFVLGLGTLLLATYYGADTTPYNIVGYTGSQEPWVYQLTNMCCVSSAILLVIASIVTIFGFLAKKF